MEIRKRQVDTLLFLLTIIFLVGGILLVFDASYATAGQAKYTGGDSFYFFKRQAVFAVAGLIVLLITSHIPYWKLRGLAPTLLFISIFGLVAVFIPGLGIEVNGASRWIGIKGSPIQIQPSELTKIALVLFLAVYLSNKKTDIRRFKEGLIIPIALMGITGILIMAEPDMGTAIIICGTWFAMLFMAGARKKHLLVIFLAGVILGSLLIIIEPYRLARVTSFRNPFADYYGSGYQVCRSLIALGSGGIRGVGLCEGREKCFYLPAEHTDFILATLGEELGLIGTLSLAGLFLIFGLRGLAIAYRTKENFGKLLAAGISILICGQALLNMLVVTSSVPATGVPLPFISYGGSSLVLNLFGVGILLGISKYPEPVKEYINESRNNRRRNRRTRISGYEYS
ncbi:MAG: putative lipid II flippase FtsW [Armatimonadota bacterium]|nr:putative lipid II flippase FtsW [Armatimonadota bacterium]